MADEAAATAPPPSPFQAQIDALNRLTTRQKLAAGIGIALLLALLIAASLWNREPPYSVLFSDFDERDGGQIVAALTQQNVPYRYSDNGRAILVPQAQVHDLRLRLASQGLPKGGLVGFEIMEGQKLGISQFAEQINYQRGLEGELSRSIQTLAAVHNARVHLAIPKQSAFLRDDTKTSASVIITLNPGRALDKSQVAGIVHLISSSVPHLSPANVSVIDQDGDLISKRDTGSESGLDPAQLRYLRQLETEFTKRIEDILTPVVGANNVRAKVTADIDFSQFDQVAENYKPNPTPETAIRSQQTTESGGNTPSVMGVPGALTNQPPVPATAPITTPPVPGGTGGAGGAASSNQSTYTRNATVNYEVDKTVRHTKGAPGTIRRMSAAVAVNYLVEKDKDGKETHVPLSEERLKQINDLSREAIGFNQARGDTLSVANAPFTPEEAAPSIPLWKDPEAIALAKDLLRYLVIGGIAFYLWMKLIKPAVDKLTEPPPKTPEEIAAEEAAAAKAAEEEAAKAAEEEAMVDLSTTQEQDAQQIYEGKLAQARDLARADPKAAAQIIKDWMDGGADGK